MTASHRALLIGLFVIAFIGSHLRADEPPATQPAAKDFVVFQHSALDRLPPDMAPLADASAGPISASLAREQRTSIQIGVGAVDADLSDIRLTLELPDGIDATVYHRIEPKLAESLAANGLTTPGKIPDVYLQPGDSFGALARGQSMNFWITFHAAADAPAGAHRGKLRIEAADKPATEIELSLRVRPFALAPSRAAFGMYFSENHNYRKPGVYYTGEELSAVFRDMAEHGQNSIAMHGGGDFSQLPPKDSWAIDAALPAGLETGLLHPEIPCIVISHNIQTLDAAKQKQVVDWINAQRQQNGWPELLLYTQDEPAVPLPEFREKFAPLRDLPVRVTTAMSNLAAWAYGDFHDVWVVHDGAETPELQAEAERLGAEVWTYSYRMLREEGQGRLLNSPLRQRFYAGLHTWANNLGGNYVWAYSHLDTTMSHVWWMPDSHQPLPTAGWEARREGVDDYRYLQMMQDIVTARAADPATASDPMTVDAQAWLEILRARAKSREPHRAEAGKPFDPAEYDMIRDVASAYIEKFQSAAPAAKTAPPRALKDEAAAFRGKSIEQCIAALDDADAAQRRAAACALAEMGADAAPAAPQLAQALADPDVRMQALRALLAIGPEARAASSKIAALLAHPDRFVRNAAMITLLPISQGKWEIQIEPYYLGYDDADLLQPELKTSDQYYRQRLTSEQPR